MTHKMRGFIDPYTLGFLIGLIGTVTVLSTHEKSPSHKIEVKKQSQDVIQSNKMMDNKTVYSEVNHANFK